MAPNYNSVCRKSFSLEMEQEVSDVFPLSRLSLFLHATGVGGNLVAIQASRISTYLHFWSVPGVLPFKMKEHWPNPCITFFSSGTYSRDLQPEMLQALIKNW